MQVSEVAVAATIATFARMDERGDKQAMNKLALRLQKEQPHLLSYAAQTRVSHGDAVGEAAVFYTTLIWAMFAHGRVDTVPRVTTENLEAAGGEVAGLMASISSDTLPYDRIAPALHKRQPILLERIRDLLEEDVREKAMTSETCAAIIEPICVITDCIDGVVTGRRPGQRQGTMVATATPGRNDLCHCGSGKKFKRCHGG